MENVPELKIEQLKTLIWFKSYEEANQLESLAPSLTKLVSDIAWKREIRKNSSISEIYERSIESIVIKS